MPQCEQLTTAGNGIQFCDTKEGTGKTPAKGALIRSAPITGAHHAECCHCVYVCEAVLGTYILYTEKYCCAVNCRVNDLRSHDWYVRHPEQKPCSGELMQVVSGRCHYTGRLASNNAVFDSSYERGRPLSFKIGVRQVIAGEGALSRRARHILMMASASPRHCHAGHPCSTLRSAHHLLFCLLK